MQEAATKQWTRETPWRQGHVLPSSAIEQLDLLNPLDQQNTCVVVISHDCDLANDNLSVEPNVEVIVGRRVANPNGNFTWGKAPRTLHLPFHWGKGEVVVELVSTDKTLVKKSDLAQFDPEPEANLGGQALAVLRSWLGSRYNRAAFPDTFVARMGASKADTKLAKTLEPFGALISFVYFDLDEGQVVERADGDPYGLAVVLVFNPGDDAEVAAEGAEGAVKAVEAALQSRLKDGCGINLKACFSISEDDLPVSLARTLSQWRLEYMSLRSAEEQVGPLQP